MATDSEPSWGKLFKRPTHAERMARLGVRDDIATAAAFLVSGMDADFDVAALALVVPADEPVLRLMEGFVGRRLGILVLTERRLLFVARDRDRGVVFTIDRPLITKARAEHGRLTGSLLVETDDARYQVDRVLGHQAEAFRDVLLGDGPSDVRQGPEPPVGAHPARPDAEPPEALLAKLTELHRAGVLTDAEWRAKVREVQQRR